MASSSSSVNIQQKYDVFLSFRGEDTRHNFTSHLYSALIKKYIAAFIDKDGLQKGDEISLELLKAIEDSIISVIIFSENYAGSRWCLDELAKIIECKNTGGQIVVPVFYHIEPTEVRHQTGSFEKAFVEHEERFKETPERVQIWRAALTQAADLSGYHVMRNSFARSEAEFVDEIVEDICKKLTDKSSLTGDCDGLVGINSRIEQLKSLLSKSQVIGIWGMGGIGKTTIAQNLFNQISRDFDGCCFIENVREELEKYGGRLLQQRIISRILGEENHVIDTPNTIPQFIKNRLQRKKALIILDDMNDSRIIDRLIGGLKPLSQDSKIIITTRDKQVLLSYGVDNIYEVEELNNDEAHLLFCKRAFKQNYPIKDLEQFSDMIINYVGGNPLAIVVLGPALCRRSKEQWDSVKDSLAIIDAPKIDNVLKISFNALQDIEKKIFLDIACFLKGEDEDLAKGVLKACYPPSPFFLGNLINKSLIKFSYKTLQMHDLLQDMGRRIVDQESENNPGKRSRLWDNKFVYDVLQQNKGTEAVESILLDMSRINEMQLSSDAFVNMTNLRLLKLYWPREHFGYQAKANVNRVLLPQGLKYLSNKLVYLRWDGCPLKALPSEFRWKKLVAFESPYSNIERPLEETKSDSSLLRRLIDPFLEGYKRLIKVPSSIQDFRNLHVLNMRECHNLKRFPRNIHFKSSVTIDLSGCINLTEFPQISGKVKILDLSGTAIEEVPTTIESLSELKVLEMSSCKKLRLIKVPSSIQYFRNLHVLNMRECHNLKRFPWNIHFTSSVTIDLSGCINLTEFPQISGKVEMLDLSGTAIEEVPTTIASLSELWGLEMSFCGKLNSISTSICKLRTLRELNLRSCLKLETLPDITEEMENLRSLDLRETAIKELPSSIENLTALKVLWLDGCENLESTPYSIGHLLNLEYVYASRTAINSFACCGKLSRIEVLKLSCCNLTEFPEVICSLSSLGYLDLEGNYFKSIPKSIKQLSKLVVLDLGNCDSLQSIPELPLRIESLSLSNCKRLQWLPELPSNEEQFDLKDDPSKWLDLRFRFENCLNLKETVSLQRMLHAATVLRRRYGKVRPFYFNLPGSEIPDWFNYRNLGSSIIIELPQQYYWNRRLIGFALCAVVSFDDSVDESDHGRDDSVDESDHGRFYEIFCEHSYANDIYCEHSYANDIYYEHSYANDFSVGCAYSIQSGHLIIGFSPCMDVRLPEGQCTTITFNFYMACNGTEPHELKCCGVCPIYEEPNMALSGTSIERFSSTREDLKEAILVDCSNSSGSGDSRSSDEKL